jgi:hypothetical protein
MPTREVFSASAVGTAYRHIKPAIWGRKAPAPTSSTIIVNIEPFDGYGDLVAHSVTPKDRRNADKRACSSCSPLARLRTGTSNQTAPRAPAGRA